MKTAIRFRRLGLGAGALAALGGCVEPTQLEREWTSLERPASAEVWATTERSARALLDEFPGAMERVEATMSLTRADSELNRINLEAGDSYYRVQDRDLFRAVALAVDYARASDGAFDPTIGPLRRIYRRTTDPDEAEIASALEQVSWPSVVLEREVFAVHFLRPGMQLDLDGMIEGYALDVAARKFVRTGSLAGVLRLAHHVYAWGNPPGQKDWWLDVSDPRSRVPKALVRLRIEASRGVGVSGAGGESDLVLDPRSGHPASSDVLVSIAIADSVADAIAVSRGMLVGGSTRAGVMLQKKTHRVEAVLLVRNDGQPSVVASASLLGRIEPTDALSHETSDRIRFLLPPSELKGRLE